MINNIFIRKIYNKYNSIIDWLYFGKIEEVVVDRIDGTPCEVKYIGRHNRIVGYWAYGYYDPAFPFPRKVQSDYIKYLKGLRKIK